MFPNLFHLGGFTLHTFAVMVFVGYLVGAWIVRREAVRVGLDELQVARLCGWALVAVIVGGRLGYLVFERPDLLLSWEALKIWHGGLQLYGGFFAVGLVVVVYSVAHRWPILRITDLFSQGGTLGLAIGRWGCFFAGDDYGKPTRMPWGVTFRHPDSLVPPELRGVPLHPTQLYLSLNALVIFFLLRALSRRSQVREGQCTAAVLMLYAVGRSFIELFRGDADRGFIGPLSTSQFLSIFVFLGGAALWLGLRLRDRSDRATKSASPA